MKGGSNVGTKGKSEDGPGAKTKGSPSILPYVMKYLAGDALAAAIIGKGGSTIAEIRTSCNAKLGLTDKGEIFPGTECRVLTAQATSEADLNQVSAQVVDKLVELVKSAGASEACGNDGELKLRALVPRGAVGSIIGKGGGVIKELRESTGAKISIGEPVGSGQNAEQIISISGSAEALRTVLAEVNRQIQLLTSEPWFSTWSTTSSTMKAMGNGMALTNPLLGGQNSGITTMMQVAQGMPNYVMEDSRGFALSCVVPNRLVGGLIGRGGAGTKEVQMLTGTKIGIREIPDDPDNRSLNIAGPLANTCAAYMLMMKRYLDSEAASLSAAKPAR